MTDDPSLDLLVRLDRALKYTQRLEHDQTDIIRRASADTKALGAQVARLEGEKAAMAAVLRAWAEDIACPKCEDGEEMLGGDLVDCSHCKGSCIDWPRFYAALSGEGKAAK